MYQPTLSDLPKVTCYRLHFRFLRGTKTAEAETAEAETAEADLSGFCVYGSTIFSFTL